MRIGSLCSGMGGLEMGVQAVYGGTTAWVSDIDKGACKILAHRFPGVPNIGDMTTVDWADVEPVDLICAGFPCQPVSNAGKQRGDQDERWLWDDVLRAVREVRPGVVVLENVRGLLTARDGKLFGRVLGSLADLGYDASWHGIKAADVGAPHNRFRVFIVATDASGQRHGAGQDGPGVGRVGGEDEGRPQERQRPRSITGGGVVQVATAHTDGPGLQGVSDGARDAGTAVAGGHPGTTDWRAYTDAIRRWEFTLGRIAPPATVDGRDNPAFVEWMMGLPAGWVTDVPGITRNEALKALGNGVVWQQAAEALRVMASWEVAA